MKHAFRQSQYYDCWDLVLIFFFVVSFFYEGQGENTVSFHDIRADCSFVYKKTKERGDEDGTF